MVLSPYGPCPDTLNTHHFETILKNLFSAKDKEPVSALPGITEQRVLERIEARLTIGAWCVGAVSGLVRAYHLDENILLWMLAGLFLVLAGGVAGCFLGVLGHYLRRIASPYPENGPELLASLALGSGSGSFLGAVAAVVGGYWKAVPWCAAGGALLLCLAFALTGDLVRVIMRMLAWDSRAVRRSKRSTHD